MSNNIALIPVPDGGISNDPLPYGSLLPSWSQQSAVFLFCTGGSEAQLSGTIRYRTSAGRNSVGTTPRYGAVSEGTLAYIDRVTMPMMGHTFICVQWSRERRDIVQNSTKQSGVWNTPAIRHSVVRSSVRALYLPKLPTPTSLTCG
jgi:hypothetical protein